MTEPTTSPPEEEQPTATTPEEKPTSTPPEAEPTATPPEEDKPATDSSSPSADDDSSPPESTGSSVESQATPVPDAPTPTSPPPVPERAQLIYSPADNGLSGADEKIPLQFNPETIKFSRNVKFKEDPPVNTTNTNSQSSKQSVAIQNREEQLKQQGATVISIGQLLFDGPLAKGYADQLLNWLEPVQAPPGKTEGKSARVISFVWGTQNYRCKLENVALTFVRFARNGTPTRVKVDLTLRHQPQKDQATNPTSGGLVGRQSHVVVQGENLQRIAHVTYGDPGAWRAIASLNGIDDPLRVPAGAEIFLPNGDELMSGGRR